ncbi:hypothetical protein HERIO_793 [Hepatospora eriocheir]|uniref:Uncharacterized protein n=2 Tax=Hepatospora eriocheir TaxID=1081669 RepID=A0A1X0QC34_9MICR|nr:hypothetical protein HERIO_793 [Hepatospora eriocheir]
MEGNNMGEKMAVETEKQMKEDKQKDLLGRINLMESNINALKIQINEMTESLSTNSNILVTISNKLDSITNNFNPFNTHPAIPTKNKKLKLAYVSGFGNMKITDLKERIAKICKVEKVSIANIEFIPDKDLIEIAIFKSIVPQFINGIVMQPDLEIVSGRTVIMQDQTGIIKRLNRVMSENVKNTHLKSLYIELKKALDANDQKEIDSFIIDEFYK